MNLKKEKLGMKKFNSRFARMLAAGVTALVLCMSQAMLYAQGDPTGKWKVTVDMGGTLVPSDLIVTANDDGTLSGKIVSSLGEAELNNVTFEGDTLAFTQSFGEGETALVMKFEGTLDGDSFSGMLSSEMGEMAVEGKRDPGIVGAWTLTSNSQLGEITRPLTINDDMSATYGDYEVTDLALEGSTLTFKVSVNVDGQEIPLEFSGDQNDAGGFDGAFAMGGQEMAEVAIVRVVEIFGDWVLTSDSELGVISLPFTLNEDMSGTYSEFDVENAAFEGGTLTFDVTVSIEGTEIPLNFDGDFDGDGFEGAFLMQGQQVASVVIARVSEAN